MEDDRLSLQWLRQTNDTQALLRKLQISESALNAYESGRRVPRDEVKQRIRQAAAEQRRRLMEAAEGSWT